MSLATRPYVTTDPDTRQLTDEINRLGRVVGEVVRQHAGEQHFETIELVRRLSWMRREENVDATQSLARLVRRLDQDALRIVIRAFSVFLDLVNVAEDRQRVRVLRQRARQAESGYISESIGRAVQELAGDGQSAREIRQRISKLDIGLVLTAHPTEAKRRTVRGKLRRIRDLLDQLDRAVTPAESRHCWRRIQAEVTKLWQTDFIRPWRPSVLQEVRRGLYMKKVLWQVAPTIIQQARDVMSEIFPAADGDVGSLFHFGSWIGGDRDGHPFVTTDITWRTFRWLRAAALDLHLETCEELRDSLSFSQRQVSISQRLRVEIDRAAARWPSLARQLKATPPNEAIRRWLVVIRWRLRRTREMTVHAAARPGAYRAADELRSDVELIAHSLEESGHRYVVEEELQPWLDRIQLFGFHLAQLDVRQDARVYREVVDELLVQLGWAADPAALSESQRSQLLRKTMYNRQLPPSDSLSQAALETLDLFRLLRRVAVEFGPAAIGGHVLSMTHTPSDVLTVLWLWEQTAQPGEDDEQPRYDLPVIPLFETIEGLHTAAEVVDQLLHIPEYRRHVAANHDRQIVMLGYSDSTKDGGYLAACWALYQAQKQLSRIGETHGVEMVYFHGRGGALGRGGGPTARSILSLPPHSFSGALRLTEQGEVLAERYDNPDVARRHLEQLAWSALLSVSGRSQPAADQWLETLQQLADASQAAYRRLVERPGFVDYFRRATPIAEIEQLPIGSRPSRRRGGSTLSDLRAIPWVFSWTQCRCLIPAWYGIGASVDQLLASQPEKRTELQQMYRQWPFFQATIDNAVLALAKTDLKIAEQYAQLASDEQALAGIGDEIAAEFVRTRQAILEITGHDELLDDVPWLQESLQFRNPYVDPLNLIQVELLRRLQQPEDDADDTDHTELRHLLRLTIKGVASGMRNTG